MGKVFKCRAGDGSSIELSRLTLWPGVHVIAKDGSRGISVMLSREDSLAFLEDVRQSVHGRFSKTPRD